MDSTEYQVNMANSATTSLIFYFPLTIFPLQFSKRQVLRTYNCKVSM